MKLNRRHFLKGGAALLAFLGFCPALPAEASSGVTGSILGASSKFGHKLWKMAFTSPADTIEKDVVIIGGGIAGLGAAYRLSKSGVKNFTVLELESEAGGNAHSGKNNVSAYPWGAHYVPLLTEESRAVRKLFEELSIIKSYDGKGLPVYDEFYLCSDPQERLFMFGSWQETLLPQIGATAEDRRQYAAFFGYMESLKKKHGKDGKKPFAIPVDESSQDDEWLALDKISMKEWMDKAGYDSKYLQWHVDYSCRDDYGTTLDNASAWAGHHYFAARSGLAANTDPGGLLTWPEGNGFLVRKLAEPVASNIVPQALVYSVKREGEGVTVDYLDTKNDTSHRIKAKTAILAIPQFIGQRLAPDETSSNDFSYAPWVVANITLDRMPEGKGAELSWDNMIYNSKLLGYVVATHQGLEDQPRQTVITYYWPLSHLDPKAARQEALDRSYEQWRDIFLEELLNVHPELKGHVKHLDVWVWGHAMVRPTTSFIWGDARRKVLDQKPPLFRAHSDMSGISIFEEAYTHGIRAAENTLKHLGMQFETEL